MAYSVRFKPAAAKDLRKLDKRMQRRLSVAIDSLSIEPRPSSCKKLKGSEFYRIRVGDYRVIYEVDDGKLVVLVIRARHRREVY